MTWDFEKNACYISVKFGLFENNTRDEGMFAAFLACNA